MADMKKMVYARDLTVKFYPSGFCRYQYDREHERIRYQSTLDAIRRYDGKNREAATYRTHHSMARRFIRELGTIEDVEGLIPLMKARLGINGIK